MDSGPSTECPSEESLIGFVRGEVSATLLAALVSHIDGCGSCRGVCAHLAHAMSGRDTRDSSSSEPRRADEPPTVGSRVGRYRVLSLIGEGGMGRVYAAHDPQLDRVVALKLLHRAQAPCDDQLEREARLMGELSHPNIVAVYDVGSHGGQSFVVMELIRGGSLRHRLADLRPNLRAIIELFVAAGEGLRAAHLAGIVHCDFKPDNVLVGVDGRPRVTDFGLARRHGAITARLGTRAYMAPEQWRGERVDPRTDVYALCAALDEALVDHRRPRWLQRVIARGMATAADERFPTMDGLLSALRSGLMRRPRAWRLAIVAASVGLTVSATLFATRPSVPGVCASVPEEGVWFGARRAEARRAFLATHRPHAADAFARVDLALTRYERSLRDARQEACALIGEVKRDLVERRLACLGDRGLHLDALVARLQRADGESVDGASRATWLLEPVSRCVLPQGTRSAYSAEGRRALAGARALSATSAASAASALAELVRSRAGDRGEPGLEAEALHVQGLAEAKAGRFLRAEELLTAAVARADASRDHWLRAEALIDLLRVSGSDLAHLDVARALETIAEGAVHHVAADDQLRGRLSLVRARVSVVAGRLDEASAALHSAIASFTRAGSPALADAQSLLSVVLRRQGRREDALNVGLRALALHEQQLGPHHPEVAATIVTIAPVYARLGRYDEGRALLERARRLLTRVVGPSHVSLAPVHANLSQIMLDTSDFAGAAREAGSAVELFERSHGPQSPKVLGSLLNFAIAKLRGQRFLEAREAFERASRICAQNPKVSVTLSASALSGLGLSSLRLGRVEAAVRFLQQGWELRQRGTHEPESMAATAFALAEALWSAGDREGRGRALALAREALEHLEESPAHADEKRRMRRWIAARRVHGL